jgi:hypothetical protein
MLSRSHFYHRTIRKMVVAFGTIFNDIKLVRYNKAGTAEIERITVPLSYAQKEKFYNRIIQDSNLDRTVQITLPRMSFELDAISYDPLRKISNFNQTFLPSDASTIKSFRAVPYNFDFSLSIYVRNVEDGTQIVEQILPYFNPDLTLTGDVLGLGQNVDLPVVLQSINSSVDAEGSPDTTRMIIWTLTFTMKGFMYGPVSNTDIIRKVTANTYDSTYQSSELRSFTVNTATGSGGTGNYKVNELVYEGRSALSANATAFVQSWNASTNTLVVVDTKGIFQTGRFVFGAVTNAAYNLISTSEVTGQLTKLTVTPNPNTANVNTAFGFDTTLEEFPDIT